MYIFKFAFLFIGKILPSIKNSSKELILPTDSIIKNSIDIRNKTEKGNIEDIINFFYKKDLLYTLLNSDLNQSLNDYNKLMYIKDLYLHNEGINTFNLTAGGLYKDW